MRKSVKQNYLEATFVDNFNQNCGDDHQRFAQREKMKMPINNYGVGNN